MEFADIGSSTRSEHIDNNACVDSTSDLSVNDTGALRDLLKRRSHGSVLRKASCLASLITFTAPSLDRVSRMYFLLAERLAIWSSARS